MNHDANPVVMNIFLNYNSLATGILIGVNPLVTVFLQLACYYESQYSPKAWDLMDL
jgi:hypothetical protein